jgi:hypothetical protein
LLSLWRNSSRFIHPEYILPSSQFRDYTAHFCLRDSASQEMVVLYAVSKIMGMSEQRATNTSIGFGGKPWNTVKAYSPHKEYGSLSRATMHFGERPTFRTNIAFTFRVESKPGRKSSGVRSKRSLSYNLLSLDSLLTVRLWSWRRCSSETSLRYVPGNYVVQLPPWAPRPSHRALILSAYLFYRCIVIQDLQIICRGDSWFLSVGNGLSTEWTHLLASCHARVLQTA